MPGSFIDTNVLIYAVSSDAAKADRAISILNEGGVISVQVLNEAANVARRKMRLGWSDTLAFLSTLRALLRVEPMAIQSHETGLALAERYAFSIDDAMIAASALNADCHILWSEDMQDGMVIGTHLRVKNPFRSAV
jgi:predicted nucleic acid-binding protein